MSVIMPPLASLEWPAHLEAIGSSCQTRALRDPSLFLPAVSERMI